jgi:hypothetical protein
MGKILVSLLMLCVSVGLYANDGRHVVFTSGNSLPVTYGTGSQSLVASEMFSMKHLNLTNRSNYSIACLSVAGDVGSNTPFAANAPATPPNGREGREIFLAASESVRLMDFYPSENLFCRGEFAPVTSGDLYMNAW